MSASSLQNATALLVIDIVQLLLMNNNLSMVVIGGLVPGVIFRSYPQRTLFACDTLPPIHPGAIF